VPVVAAASWTVQQPTGLHLGCSMELQKQPSCQLGPAKPDIHPVTAPGTTKYESQAPAASD